MATTEHPPSTSRLRTWMLEGLSDMGKAGGHTGPHAEPEPPHKGQRGNTRRHQASGREPARRLAS
ncbi:hypothetical protein [Streptomyces sp. NPDC007856]|uniref:hypothetical protein n=1 Tax=Streptomyces sp. NPDC007856 TaxID=3364781 RepID=UPI0036A60D7E